MNPLDRLRSALLSAFAFAASLAVAAPGDVDALDLNIANGGDVEAIAVQPDGKVIIAGALTSVLGVPRQSVARLKADGTLDLGFDPNPGGGYPFATGLAVQSDGKIVLVGIFDKLQPNRGRVTVVCNSIARVNADGTVDLDFRGDAGFYATGVALQPDKKILVWGPFRGLQPVGAADPIRRSHIARFNVDGSLDMSFDPNPSDGAYISGGVVQPDGKILITGSFRDFMPNGAGDPVSRSGIARLNADGSVDLGFDPNPDSTVSTVALQADGKILIGGTFTTFQPNGTPNPVARKGIARLDIDGSVDLGFDPNPGAADVSMLAVQADGKILFGGGFSDVRPNGAAAPVTRNYIARVNADGSLDPSSGRRFIQHRIAGGWKGSARGRLQRAAAEWRGEPDPAQLPRAAEQRRGATECSRAVHPPDSVAARRGRTRGLGGGFRPKFRWWGDVDLTRRRHASAQYRQLADHHIRPGRRGPGAGSRPHPGGFGRISRILSNSRRRHW